MNKEWEEVSEEELWADGERRKSEVIQELVYRILDEGDWVVMRKISDRNKPHPSFGAKWYKVDYK